MDSFYDAPRRPPLARAPAPPASTNKIFPNHVPDVSMLEQNHGNAPLGIGRNSMSYNAWRLQHNFGKENSKAAAPSSQASILRKQVRFQSPQTQQPFKPLLPMENTMPQVKENFIHAPIYNAPRSTNNIVPAKPFERVYMSNIPNRNLDLSIIESKVKQSRECQRPIPHAAESTTIEPQPQKANDEPTVKDLMKIIQQQNEQLLCLQKQVSSLLQERNEKAQPPVRLEPQKVLPKFAFDVMTSFEVSLRPPAKKTNPFAYQRPKIEEILEAPRRVTDLSLTLNEPIVVEEESHSPENSIHVEMQDFSSESEDDEASNHSLIGWTIYNNVMDQVNHLLKKSPDQNQQGENTMKKVKEATLKHLKSVGVNLANVDQDEVTPTDSYGAKDISFAVKQLLMKYLPDEQLAKINKAPDIENKIKHPTNLINRRPEFSMATVQYMEKYNLLNNKDKQANKVQGNFLDMTALKQQPKLL